MMSDTECCYFDAVDDSLASTSGSGYDTGDDDDDCVQNGSGLLYDVWTRTPLSVEERRRLFRKWLGWSSIQGNSSSSSSCREGSDVESFGLVGSNGDVSRMCSSRVEDNYLSWSSMLPCSDDLTESSVKKCASDLNVCRIRNATQGTMDHLEVSNQDSRYLRQCQSFPISHSNQITEQTKIDRLADVGVATKGNKNKWLKRLRSFTCTMDNKVKLDLVQRSLSKCGCNSPSLRRVKVQQCRKKIKELSALYMVQEILAHRGSILTMKFSPDGQFLASAGEDMIVCVWQVTEADRSSTLDMPDLDPSSLYFTVNHLSDLAPLFADRERLGKPKALKKSPDSACVIFPPKVFHISEKPLHEFNGHCGAVLDLSWSDKNHLLSSSDDNTVRLWRVGTGHCLQVFSHCNFVTCVEFNPVNNDYFISGCLDGKVRMWSISRCQVVDWIDIKELVTAICYSPDAQGGIVGTMSGSCHFFNISDNLLQRGSFINLHHKKKSPFKKITGFQFLPHDNNKVMVTSADSKVRIMHGINIIKKYKGPSSTGFKTASLTAEGKHIVASSDDSNIYVWNCNADERPAGSKAKNIRSWEHFSANASVAIPWKGIKLSKVDTDKKTKNTLVDRSSSLPFTTPACFCLRHGYLLESFPKGAATWPEESLPKSSPLASRSSNMQKSQYKLFKSSCQSTSKSHAWGLVIVAAGWDGRIRAFHNYGLPAVT